MRVGIQVPSFTFASGPARLGPTLAEIAQAAERNDFESFWVMDHFFQIPLLGPAEQEMLEGYSALAFCAAVTERIRLGTMVTGVTYRQPGVLAKTVTTLVGFLAFRSERRRPGRALPAAQPQTELMISILVGASSAAKASTSAGVMSS